jgi:uncharacterized membrane protein
MKIHIMIIYVKILVDIISCMVYPNFNYEVGIVLSISIGTISNAYWFHFRLDKMLIASSFLSISDALTSLEYKFPSCH